MRMSAEMFHTIDNLLQKGERFAVATIVEAEGSTPREEGAKMIVRGNGDTIGTIGGDLAEGEVVEESLDALEEDEPRTVEIKLEEGEKGGVGMKCGGRIKVFVDILKPSSKLVLIGSGKVVKAVAELAEFVGFVPIVIDPFAERGEFSASIQVISEPVEEGIKQVDIDPQSYIVIITRHKYDEVAILEALETEASYIGLMGSENRVISLFQHLESEKDVDRDDLSRVNAPIGLDIGSETPEEIAVSILGEIIRKKRDPEASGTSLKIDY